MAYGTIEDDWSKALIIFHDDREEEREKATYNLIFWKYRQKYRQCMIKLIGKTNRTLKSNLFFKWLVLVEVYLHCYYFILVCLFITAEVK